jgi:XTP/dITP diphosphohydrolase
VPHVLLATTNAHKAREIASILTRYGIDAVEPARFDPPVRLAPVDETGATFAENARLKAVAAAVVAGRPALADDSGLVVPALDGEPGVRSARYAGEHASDAENNARLLREIAARGLLDPPAAFVCVAVLAAADGRVLAEAEGRVEGVVRGPPRGRNGFGYDPLFHYRGPGAPPEGVRFGELPPAEKDSVSHRGRAFRSIAARILALLADDPRALD